MDEILSGEDLEYCPEPDYSPAKEWEQVQWLEGKVAEMLGNARSPGQARWLIRFISAAYKAKVIRRHTWLRVRNATVRMVWEKFGKDLYPNCGSDAVKLSRGIGLVDDSFWALKAVKEDPPTPGCDPKAWYAYLYHWEQINREDALSQAHCSLYELEEEEDYYEAEPEVWVPSRELEPNLVYHMSEDEMGDLLGN